MPSRLRERDLRALLQLVGEAHDADDLPEYRSTVLHGLPRLVATDYISYNEVDPGQGVVSVVLPDDLPEKYYEVFARLAHQNPLIDQHTRTRDGRPYRFSDVVSRRELHRLDLYQQFYGEIGIECQIAIALPSRPGTTIGIALSRGRPDFSERDREVLNLARPHLVQAYRKAKNRERLLEILAAVRRGLDDGSQSLAVVDPDRRIAFLTARAQRDRASLAGHDLDVEDRLPEAVDTWVATSPAPVPLVLDGGRPLTIRRLPGKPDEPQVLFFQPGMPALSVSGLHALGLTPREADVLHGIVLGRSNAGIAQSLGISPRTVHKHVEHIFGKLGVSSRVEAVATVWAAFDDT